MLIAATVHTWNEKVMEMWQSLDGEDCRLCAGLPLRITAATKACPYAGVIDFLRLYVSPFLPKFGGNRRTKAALKDKLRRICVMTDAIHVQA